MSPHAATPLALQNSLPLQCFSLALLLGGKSINPPLLLMVLLPVPRLLLSLIPLLARLVPPLLACKSRRRTLAASTGGRAVLNRPSTAVEVDQEICTFETVTATL